MAATICLDDDQSRSKLLHWARIAPLGTVVRFLKPKRTIPQNNRMWAMLTVVSENYEHNGQKYTTETWKALFMHALKHEVKFVMGLNGEPFPLGFHSSDLLKPQMTELMDFIEYWCAERDPELAQKVSYERKKAA